MKLVTCALCDSDQYEVVDENPNIAINLGERVFRRKITNVICRRCGLVYNNPRMEADELDELYTAMSRHFVQGTDALEKRSPLATGEQIEQFEFVRRYVASVPLAGMKVLEIGCGLGRFLRLIREAGSHAVGIEPSRWDAEFARKINSVEVIESMFEPDVFDPESFDLVASFFVLEHIADPIGFLSGIHRLLKVGGHVVLEVPDASNPFVAVTNFFSLGHLFSYSPHTLRQILTKVGFAVDVLEQIGGADNSAKDFPRLRVLARKSTAQAWIKPDGKEYARMSKIMARWRSERFCLIERIEARLEPYLRSWRDRGARVLVYGAGTHSNDLMHFTSLKSFEVIGFIDNNPIFQRHRFLGRPVYSAAEIDQLDPDGIVISVRPWEQQIWESLAPQRARGTEVVSLYRDYV
jgi:SAM-dependent methyltransferase